jgi:hypothetical protein
MLQRKEKENEKVNYHSQRHHCCLASKVVPIVYTYMIWICSEMQTKKLQVLFQVVMMTTRTRVPLLVVFDLAFSLVPFHPWIYSSTGY